MCLDMGDLTVKSTFMEHFSSDAASSALQCWYSQGFQLPSNSSLMLHPRTKHYKQLLSTSEEKARIVRRQELRSRLECFITADRITYKIKSHSRTRSKSWRSISF